nr:hypothetical protein [uncultured Clostridium sp.]
MRTYQMNGKPEILEFTNYERLDEEKLFSNVYEKLKENSDISIGEKKTGPSEDFYKCTLLGSPFTLFFDIDYGPSIYAESPEVIQKLINYFEVPENI